MKRRTFLKIIGMGSLSFAPGCTSRPEKNLFSHVEAPEDMVTGKATWYATTCRECPAGCGILAKNREGRVIKIEGNPLHPINRGRLCMRGQASLQGVYNPDRITKPLLRKHDGWRTNDVRWRVVSFREAEAILKEKIEKAVKRGPGRVRVLTEVVGHSLGELFARPWKNGTLRFPGF
jgi:molybdopterin-containing oxidoreductase family iron-sulfur binding subunit